MDAFFKNFKQAGHVDTKKNDLSAKPVVMLLQGACRGTATFLGTWNLWPAKGC